MPRAKRWKRSEYVSKSQVDTWDAVRERNKAGKLDAD